MNRHLIDHNLDTLFVCIILLLNYNSCYLVKTFRFISWDRDKSLDLHSFFPRDSRSLLWYRNLFLLNSHMKLTLGLTLRPLSPGLSLLLPLQYEIYNLFPIHMYTLTLTWIFLLLKLCAHLNVNQTISYYYVSIQYFLYHAWIYFYYIK